VKKLDAKVKEAAANARALKRGENRKRQLEEEAMRVE